MTDSPRFTSIKSAAAAAGVTRTTVRTWSAKRWIDPPSPEGWSLDELLEAKRRGERVVAEAGRDVRRNGKRSVAPSTVAPVVEVPHPTPEQARRMHDALRTVQLRYRAAKAGLAELELAQVRGELMLRSEAESRLLAFAHGWARTVRLRGRRLAQSLVGLSSFAEIRARIDEDGEQMLAVWAGAETIEEAVAAVEHEDAEAEEQESVA